MAGDGMTIERLEDLTSLWGADLAAWPDGPRAEAEVLLASSADARAALERMAALDQAFGAAIAAEGVSPSPVPTELISRVLADAASVSAEVRRPSPPPRLERRRASWLSTLLSDWRPVAACASAAAVGVWFGYAGPADVSGVGTAANALTSEFLSSSPLGDFALLDLGSGASMSIFERPTWIER